MPIERFPTIDYKRHVHKPVCRQSRCAGLFVPTLSTLLAAPECVLSRVAVYHMLANCSPLRPIEEKLRRIRLVEVHRRLG
jgi:hypothetical protein